MRLKPIIPALLASALMAGPAFAQAEGPSQRTLGTTTDGKRIVSMVIYGEDPCPEGKDGEIVSPGVFVPLAERIGLMPKIDLHIVTRALRWLGANRAFNSDRPRSASRCGCGDP